jgi:rhomboid protease GluP
LANCSQCGAKLPTFSFGEMSTYCKACQAQRPPDQKPAAVDVLGSLGAERSGWLTATNGLIAINIAVFLVMVAYGVSWINPGPDELLRWGADYGPNTLGGEYWRIVTSAFVHIGIVHLLLNMWCLWSLGRLLERLLGPVQTLSVYLVTGAGASLLSLAAKPLIVSAGASGAIFGIAGVLISVFYYGKLNLPAENVRKLLGYVVRFALLNLLYGLRGNINNMAHLGGLVTGLLAGVFLAKSFSLAEEDRGPQRRTVMVLAAIAVGLFVIPVAKAKSYAVALNRGKALLAKQDYSSAIEQFKKYTAAQPEDADGRALLGSALQGAKRYDEAVQEYERGLVLEPGYAFIQINLAEIYLYRREPEKAVKLYREGIPRIDADAEIYYNYARALEVTGNLGEAEEAVRKAIRLNGSPDARTLLAEITKLEAAAPVEGKIDAKQMDGRNAANKSSASH